MVHEEAQRQQDTALEDARRRGRFGGRRDGETGTIVVHVGPNMTLDSMVPRGFTRLDLMQLNPELEWPYVDGSRMRPAGYNPAPGAARVAYQGGPDASAVLSAAGIAQPQPRALGQQLNALRGQGQVGAGAPALGVEGLQARVHEVLDRHGLDYDLKWTVGGLPFLTPKGELSEAMSSAIKAETGIDEKIRNRSFALNFS